MEFQTSLNLQNNENMVQHMNHDTKWKMFYKNGQYVA